MTSTPPPTDPATTPPTPPAPPPAKRPGVIRTSAVLLLLFLVVGVIAVFPFVIEPWIVGQIRGAVTNAGLELSPDTVIEVSLFRGRVAMSQVKISETYKGETRVVLTADALDIDLAVSECLGGDVVIDRLVATGLSGDLRRRGDGTIPLMTPPDAESSGTDWSTVDWWGYCQKAMEYAKNRKLALEKEQEEAEKLPPEQRPKPEPVQVPVSDWPAAKQFEPVLAPGSRGPRVLIHVLEISGKALGLPDATPFDVTSFSLVGKQITGVQLPDETMTVTGDLHTTGAGLITLALARNPGETGTLTLTCPALPVQLLSNPAISGQALAPYGASGTANLTIATEWDNWTLLGGITSILTDFDLNPTGGGTEAQQAAQVVKRLKGKPITWPMKLGGSLYAPTITDSGIDEMLKGGLSDAAKGAAVDEATKQVDKLLEKNPEAKKATDLLKGLGGKK